MSSGYEMKPCGDRAFRYKLIEKLVVYALNGGQTPVLFR